MILAETPCPYSYWYIVYTKLMWITNLSPIPLIFNSKANICTGINNFFVNTLEADTLSALTDMTRYIALLCGIAFSLNYFDITVRLSWPKPYNALKKIS